MEVSVGVQGDGARDAKPRTAPCGAAARWGHRDLTQRGTKGGVAGEGIGAVRMVGYGVFAG